MPTITKLFSAEEIALHNTREDCWIVVGGKVYDVSSYLDDHPGGDDVILETVGKDSTDGFEDAGHSKEAREILDTFFLGELDTSAPSIRSSRFPQKTKTHAIVRSSITCLNSIGRFPLQFSDFPWSLGSCICSRSESLLPDITTVFGMEYNCGNEILSCCMVGIHWISIII